MQWIHSQEFVKKKKKKDNIDDIELVEKNKVKVRNKDGRENKKGKIKKQSQEDESIQVKESELESLKKKRKKKTHDNDSEVSKKYKKTLEAYETNEKEQLSNESECYTKSKKKKSTNDKDINFIDNKEVVEINHGKREVKASKRKKHHSQERIEKEKSIFVENIESSSEEVMIVDSSKSKKYKLKKIGDTEEVKSRKNVVDKNIADSTSNDNSLSISDGKNVQFHNEYKESIKNMEKDEYNYSEAAELKENSKSILQIYTENSAKINKDDINQKKQEKEQEKMNEDNTDSEGSKFDDNDKISVNGKKKRKRRRKRKPKMTCEDKNDSVAQCFDKTANFLVPNAKNMSCNSRKTIETQMYNFSYSRPRNKKPMAESNIPQNKHIVYNSDEDVTIEKSIQKIDSVDDNVTKSPSTAKLSGSLWDISDITMWDNSHHDTSSPGISKPKIPPLEVPVAENSCNEISSTSMQKFTIPFRNKKTNTTEENENIFGALLEMSKSEEPKISTYVGRKMKEKFNNTTVTVTSATEQHQRRSPPKGVPTYKTENDEVSQIFHNLLATQNFSQAFICPRTPSTSKLTSIRSTNKQPVFSSDGMVCSNESIMNSHSKAIPNLINADGTCLEARIETIDSLNSDDTQKKEESEKEIEELRTFTKLTVEANMAEAKAAMNRRKRARPKAISSIGTLLNRIRAGEIDVTEESESGNREVQSFEIVDKLAERITSTVGSNESDICKYSNESGVYPLNVQTVEDKILVIGEENNFKSNDKEVDVIPENLSESKSKNLVNCEIKEVTNTCQKIKSNEINESELAIKDEEISIVELDLEVSEIKESDCMIVNSSLNKVAAASPNRKEQILGSREQILKQRQSPRVTRRSIKTEITIKDEDGTITSPIKETKSYNELGEAYFDQFPVMKVLPKVKEFVAVKLLSLNEYCIPVYSNYQQAQVLKVQGTSITLRYIDNLEKIPSKDGQVQEVDLTLEGDGTSETVDWRDVHEPRLVFP
ncbi:unnamed protein product [Meganyctiphanes norvegica]|uniref:Uncharacterized protein n=1 Tax=Meganyctiphanes norvegica TaxID=48144 RepID=A0AAV2S692_MEGNR